MPQDAEQPSEGFLDAVLEKSRTKQDRRWPGPPEDAAEEDGAAEAYLPTVVGQRIRDALRGGQGRFGLVVATLVGLASLPTWVLMRTGLDDLAPTFREPAGVLLVGPATPAPIRVPAHGHARVTAQAEPAPVIRVKPRKTVVVAQPQRVRVVERTVVAKPPPARPIAVTPPVATNWPVRALPRKHPFVRPVVLKPVVVQLPAVRPVVARPVVARQPVVARPVVARPVVPKPVAVPALPAVKLRPVAPLLPVDHEPNVPFGGVSAPDCP